MMSYAFPLTDEQRAVMEAREWRKRRLVNSEQIPTVRKFRTVQLIPTEHRDRERPVYRAASPETGNQGQVSTNGETGFYSRAA